MSKNYVDAADDCKVSSEYTCCGSGEVHAPFSRSLEFLHAKPSSVT